MSETERAKATRAKTAKTNAAKAARAKAREAALEAKAGAKGHDANSLSVTKSWLGQQVATGKAERMTDGEASVLFDRRDEPDCQRQLVEGLMVWVEERVQQIFNKVYFVMRAGIGPDDSHVRSIGRSSPCPRRGRKS